MNRRDLFKKIGACVAIPFVSVLAKESTVIASSVEETLDIPLEFPSGVHHLGTRVIPANEIIMGSMIETCEGLLLEVIDDIPYCLGDRVVLDMSDCREGYHVAKFEKKVCIVNQLQYAPKLQYYGTMGIRIVPTEEDAV